MTPLGDDICLSGGAIGADLQFGMCAGLVGHRTFHFTFEGHSTKAPGNEIVELPSEMLNRADPHLKEASKRLKRKWPVASPFVASLLRRNFYQIENVRRVYAVSRLLKSGNVAGGTGWAVAMAQSRHADTQIYLFDQFDEVWHCWNGLVGWKEVPEPECPSGLYAGIGTRELNDAGKRAIRRIYNLPEGHIRVNSIASVRT